MNENTLIIGFIIIMGLFLVSAITLGIMFMVKQRTVFRIITPNKRFIKKVFRGAVPEKVEVDGKQYIYDSEAELRNFWGAQIYYFEGNPDAIIFDSSKHTIKINAKDLKHLLKNTIIEQLLSGDSLTKIMLVLVGINLLVAVGSIALSLLSGNDCTLPMNNQTLQTISEGVKIALKT